MPRCWKHDPFRTWFALQSRKTAGKMRKRMALLGRRFSAKSTGLFARFLRMIAIAAAITTGVTGAGASQIWNGPALSFAEPSGADWTDPTNQDRITAAVWITRATFSGLFNAASESFFTHHLSPADTEWAYGQLADYASLTYADWEDWFGGAIGGGPRSTIGKPAVLHLISDDIYLAVTFTSFGGNGGGFSYDRSTASIPEPSSLAIVLLASGILFAARNRGRQQGE